MSFLTLSAAISASLFILFFNYFYYLTISFEASLTYSSSTFYKTFFYSSMSFLTLSAAISASLFILFFNYFYYLTTSFIASLTYSFFSSYYYFGGAVFKSFLPSSYSFIISTIPLFSIYFLFFFNILSIAL